MHADPYTVKQSREPFLASVIQAHLDQLDVF
jgi:hypothetical protein